MSDMVDAETLGWEEGIHYPSWVDLSQVELDQFFTQLETAETCYTDFLSFLAGKGIDVEDVLFVEPSAGTGAFSSLLPAGSIAMDLAPQDESVAKHDFLTWDATEDSRITDAKSQGKTIVAIGNPPFGTRGWMALSFLNKYISDFSYRLCGQEFKKEADVFISQGYFPGTPMSISKEWDDILYGSGYGIKALNGKADEMLDALRNAN